MSENTVILDPWNSKNNYITEEDIYKIFFNAGLGKTLDETKKVFKINGKKGLEYYQIAFVHPSYVKKCIMINNMDKEDEEKEIKFTPKPENVTVDLFEEHKQYENQEFLGDRVLDFTIANYIYNKYPDRDQGFKTVLKTKLVKSSQLAKFAKFLNFPDHLVISKQVEEKTNLGRFNDRILEDVMEAFICAIFLDQNLTACYSKELEDLNDNFIYKMGPGWQIANAFIVKLIEKIVDFEELLAKEENYKEQLLQYYQKEFKITPEYISIAVEGPPNKRIFTQGVIDGVGNIVGRGIGKKKSEAEQKASLDALKYFGVL